MKLTTDNVIAISSLVISIVALSQSWITAEKTTKLQQSNILSDLHDRMRPGRQAMESIWLEWNTDPSKQPEVLSEDQKQEFIQYYNKHYHHGSGRRQDLSDAIHTYLHELHSVWNRVKNKEFNKSNVMQKLGDGIFLDRHLIRLYLEAHWQDEDQLNIHGKKRFWHNVPIIVREAETWKMAKASIT